uniref:SLPTX15 n=1 Tax=Scolopendra viridis TaxID=118503 RepID=A0A4D5R9R4_SCOVI
MKISAVAYVSVLVILLFVSIQQTEAVPEKEVTFQSSKKKPDKNDCKKECAKKYTLGILSKVLTVRVQEDKCTCKYQVP